MPSDSSPFAAAATTFDLILDTHVILELWLFQDERVALLRQLLASRRCRWLATEAMLLELAHVRSREFAQRYTPLPELTEPPAHWMATPAQSAPWRCRDVDDQKFLDLAWQQRCALWTRDSDLLVLKKRAARNGLLIQTPEAGLIQLIAAMGCSK